MANGADAHVVVVGGGIAGLAAALRLAEAGLRVTVVESSDALGGKIRTSPFAGLPAVDEGPDAFLTRVSFASRLARRVGLGDAMTSPASGTAAIWKNGLHPIPTGLMLGVPTGASALARSPLMSWRGKARASLEPFLPRRKVPEDNLGALVRSRFGDEVHEMLVDPLVGSIYASDTDRLSMSAVPQLGDLAGRGRSMLLTGRSMRAKTAASSAPAGPIFETPTAGVGALVDATAAAARERGTQFLLGTPVAAIEPSDGGYRLVCGDGTTLDADCVVLANPAATAAPLVGPLSKAAAEILGNVETSTVVMVTMAIAGDEWPRGLTGSGYLVPKRFQRSVTAVSFASNKWAHWRPSDGTVLLRTSLGRDGLVVADRSDEDLVDAAVSEVSAHLGLDLSPTAVRLTRWPNAFPQYRPGHMGRVDALETALAEDMPGVYVAGASHRGIGIPACIQQGERSADAILDRLGVMGDSTP